MIIDHLAIWATDIERLKDYYIRYFDAESNDRYVNEKTGFTSYFLSFDNGCRIEIMNRNDIPENKNDVINLQHKGLIHFAFLVQTTEEVDKKARQLSENGFLILRGPRITGDGYYEFETADPENNRLEVMAKYTEK